MVYVQDTDDRFRKPQAELSDDAANRAALAVREDMENCRL